MKLIIDIPKKAYEKIKKEVEEDSGLKLTLIAYAIASGKPIFDKSTKGDAIMALFHDIKIVNDSADQVFIQDNNKICMMTNKNWFDAYYYDKGE